MQNVRFRRRIQPVDATLLPLAQSSVCCVDRLNPPPKADVHQTRTAGGSMQDEYAGTQTSETLLITPFSEGAKPDAFKFLYFSLGLYGLGILMFLLHRGDQEPEYWLIRTSIVATIFLFSFGGALFCKVELGHGQITVKGLFTKKTVPVEDIKSARYESSAIATRLTISTNANSIAVTSLSFSARQLNLIRNYCERRDTSS
jgi:hypothetical protein